MSLTLDIMTKQIKFLCRIPIIFHLKLNIAIVRRGPINILYLGCNCTLNSNITIRIFSFSYPSLSPIYLVEIFLLTV